MAPQPSNHLRNDALCAAILSAGAFEKNGIDFVCQSNYQCLFSSIWPCFIILLFSPIILVSSYLSLYAARFFP